jgi:hypothetical protein
LKTRKIFISKIFTRKAWGTYLIILSYKNIRNINKAFIELAGANIYETREWEQKHWFMVALVMLANELT